MYFIDKIVHFNTFILHFIENNSVYIKMDNKTEDSMLLDDHEGRLNVLIITKLSEMANKKIYSDFYVSRQKSLMN